MTDKRDSEDTTGSDNTIPDTDDGVAVGASDDGESTTFEPEEDDPSEDDGTPGT